MILRVSLSAYPAPLELADVASHVVAPRRLLNFGLAFGAEGNVNVGSFKDLRVHLFCVFFAGLTCMLRLSALEAHSVTALFAFHGLDPGSGGPTEAFTAWLSAPPH